MRDERDEARREGREAGLREVRKLVGCLDPIPKAGYVGPCRKCDLCKLDAAIKCLLTPPPPAPSGPSGRPMSKSRDCDHMECWPNDCVFKPAPEPERLALGTCRSEEHQDRGPHARYPFATDVPCINWRPPRSRNEMSNKYAAENKYAADLCERIQRVFVLVQEQTREHRGTYPCVCSLILCAYPNKAAPEARTSWPACDTDCEVEYHTRACEDRVRASLNDMGPRAEALGTCDATGLSLFGYGPLHDAPHRQMSSCRNWTPAPEERRKP